MQTIVTKNIAAEKFISLFQKNEDRPITRVEKTCIATYKFTVEKVQKLFFPLEANVEFVSHSVLPYLQYLV